jgi:hypothetical protein
MEAIIETPTSDSVSISPNTEVDAMITLRLVSFHNALVERGQLPPAPPAEDPIASRCT